MSTVIKFQFKKIGIIKTPYLDNAPYQPIDEDQGDFRIIIDAEYKRGIFNLESFSYIYVIYYIDRIKGKVSMTVNPPWANGKKVGLFASRSPSRPNPIGISVVRIKKISNNEIITSGLDLFDETPLLDIKPYVKELDSKNDANYGWLTELEKSKDHLLLHIKGIPHDY